MKRYMSAATAIAGALLMSGCAADGSQGHAGATRSIDRGDPPLGSLIRRKPGSTGPENASQADIQALENARTMGAGGINSGR